MGSGSGSGAVVQKERLGGLARVVLPLSTVYFPAFPVGSRSTSIRSGSRGWWGRCLNAPSRRAQGELTADCSAAGRCGPRCRVVLHTSSAGSPSGGPGLFWSLGRRCRDCSSVPVWRPVPSVGRLTTPCAVVAGRRAAASDPSWNTDQGVQHACESVGESYPLAQWEWRRTSGPPRQEPSLSFGPLLTDPCHAVAGFEWERACCDPKDGELCLNRAKPEETLVEARSGSDVQIDRQIWV